jgi:hypothetical protein
MRYKWTSWDSMTIAIYVRTGGHYACCLHRICVPFKPVNMVHAVDLSPMFNVLRIATKNSLQSFWSGVDFGKLILGYNQAPPPYTAKDSH